MTFPSFGRKSEKIDLGASARSRNGDGIFQEKFKALRAKLEYRLDMQELKTVAVTSAIAGEGKTTSCTHLAFDFAATGRKKVILIDLDLRKSDLALQCNLPPRPGLSDYLQGTASLNEIIRKPGIPSLSIIPGGETVQSPGDLFGGEKFRSLLKQVRDHFHVVLLDTPPILPVADSLSLRDQVDGFLVLFRIGFTPYKMLSEAVEEIGEKNLIGVVLNGVEPKRQKYYERYYGKYYRRADKQETPA